MLEKFEHSECDFKREVEHTKTKNWLKSVCAFANGIGGTLEASQRFIKVHNSKCWYKTADSRVEKIGYPERAVFEDVRTESGFKNSDLPEFTSTAYNFTFVLRDMNFTPQATPQATPQRNVAAGNRLSKDEKGNKD